ncbi:MAG: hypothetical protein ABIZ80_25395 [Bryobacteraceae bacterium]
MSDIISEYQRWKQQGDDLRAKAKAAMESRFRELLTEAMRVAEEYRTDFGVPLKPPATITAFRYRAGKPGKQKPSAAAPRVKTVAPVPAVEAKPDPKIAGLRKRLVTVKKKLEAAKASGAPTKNLDDKVYEIEDELRLAGAL